MNEPEAVRRPLPEAILEPLDRLIDEYADANLVISELIGDLRTSLASAERRAVRPKGQRLPSSESPSTTSRNPGERSDAAPIHADLLDLQEQLAMLEGVASVRASVPADGTPTLVVELTDTSNP